MARAQAYFVIRQPFQGAYRRAFSLNCLAAEQWQQLTDVRNVVRVDLDTAETESKSQAVTLAWRYGTDDSLLENWTVRPVPDEEAYVAAARTELQTELEQVQARIAAVVAPAKPRAEDLQREADLTRALEQLDNYRYWQNVLNPFGDGTWALYRGCNAPNIPFCIQSNWRLQPDRPFTVWLHRCQPHEGQADSWVRLRFGHWCLELRQESEVQLYRYKDGREWKAATATERGQWVAYRGTDWARIDEIESAITALRDPGRLTADDRLQIATWNNQIQELDKQVAALAQDKSLSKEALEAQKKGLKDQIGAIRQQIADLKASKQGSSPLVETQIEELEDSYLAETVEVQFQHMAESLLGNDVAITVIPQPRGYLMLHCSQGKDYWVFEDREVTEKNIEETIVASTPLEISGNGGAMWCKFSYLQPEPNGHLDGAIAIPQPTAVPSSLALQATQPPGTGVSGAVSENSWRVNLTSTAGYLPFLYRLRLDLAASPRNRALETVVLDSRSPGTTLTVRDGKALWDVGSNYDRENRGRAATLTLYVPDAAVGTVTGYANCQIQLFETGAYPWFTGVLTNPVVEQEAKNCQRVTFTCLDRWAIMRSDLMAGEPAGDGKLKGAYAREVMRGLGLWDDEIVISGPLLSERLPETPPNQPLALLPDYGTCRADWLQRFFEDFCYFCDMWFDGRGRLHLEPLGTVTKALNFTTAASGSGDRRVMANLRREDLWEEFKNDFTVRGLGPGGFPLSARYQDFTSVNDATSSRYVGRWLPATPYESQSLVTQELVNACLRWRVYRYLQAYTELDFECGYDPTLEVGDRVTCAGVPVEVVEVRADSRSEDRMSVKVRVL